MASLACGSRLVREGKTIMLVPSITPTSLVVLSHGLGDTADGFADVAVVLSRSMPHVKFIVPTAPTQPVTLNGGMSMPSWYDITSLSNNRAQENCDGIEESASVLRSILDKEHQETGIPYGRMVLAGFSQGGALSLFTGFQMESQKKLAGILCMSGYLAASRKFKINKGLEDTKVLHFHGTSDPVVKFTWAQETEAALKQQGASNYQLKSMRGVEHTITAEEMQLAAQFIGSVLEETHPVELETNGELERAVKNSGLGDKAVKLVPKNDEL